MMGFRASPALRASIVRWAETHPNVDTLSEAARLLVELGLAASSPARRSGKTNEAARMASRQLDRLADKNASEQEQASRKRRLLGGPEEFQSLRVDRRKAR
jgi:hypothetical protein